MDNWTEVFLAQKTDQKISQNRKIENSITSGLLQDPYNKEHT